MMIAINNSSIRFIHPPPVVQSPSCRVIILNHASDCVCTVRKCVPAGRMLGLFCEPRRVPRICSCESRQPSALSHYYIHCSSLSLLSALYRLVFVFSIQLHHITLFVLYNVYFELCVLIFKVAFKFPDKLRRIELFAVTM